MNVRVYIFGNDEHVEVNIVDSTLTLRMVIEKAIGQGLKLPKKNWVDQIDFVDIISQRPAHSVAGWQGFTPILPDTEAIYIHLV